MQATATTVFLVAITTARMIMPGMPAMPKLPGMADLNAPTRTLTMDLTSGGSANAQSKAECAIPGGLKLGPKVDLTIDLPEKTKASTGSTGEEGTDEATGSLELKMKSYWGCAETVPAGQPRVVDSKEMNRSMQEAMKRKEFKESFTRAVRTTAEGSHAYWPGKDNRKIAKDAACPGSYTLVTNYCGGTSFTLDKAQDFLVPIDLVSPGKKIDFGKPIKLEWKKVPNAVAYLIYAFSGAEKEMITWTSSSDPNPPANLQGEALSREQVEKYIKAGTLLPAAATSCSIPAGIFASTRSAMLTLIAFGADKSQLKDDILTHVIVRSTATAMLGEMNLGDDEELELPPAAPEQLEAEEAEPADDADDRDAADKANDAMDKADKAKGTLKRAKDILKW